MENDNIHDIDQAVSELIVSQDGKLKANKQAYNKKTEKVIFSKKTIEKNEKKASKISKMEAEIKLLKNKLQSNNSNNINNNHTSSTSNTTNLQNNSNLTPFPPLFPHPPNVTPNTLIPPSPLSPIKVVDLQQSFNSQTNGHIKNYTPMVPFQYPNDTFYKSNRNEIKPPNTNANNHLALTYQKNITNTQVNSHIEAYNINGNDFSTVNPTQVSTHNSYAQYYNNKIENGKKQPTVQFADTPSKQPEPTQYHKLILYHYPYNQNNFQLPPQPPPPPPQLPPNHHTQPCMLPPPPPKMKHDNKCHHFTTTEAKT